MEKDKYKTLEKNIKELEQNMEISYNEKQLEAIYTSLKENITIITGGPGTGKTTIIKAITKLY